MAKRPKSVAWVPANTHPDITEGHYRADAPEDDPLGGKLAVWIDEAPDDPEDGSGHFEVYNGDPSEYRAAKPSGQKQSLSGTTKGDSSTGIGG